MTDEKLDDHEFRALLDLMMVSDPWPIDGAKEVLLKDLVRAEAQERGFTGWIHAYHSFIPVHESDEPPEPKGEVKPEVEVVDDDGEKRMAGFNSIEITIDSQPDSPLPARILKDGADTYETKNEDYGESWRRAGEILWMLSDDDSIEVESESEAIKLGLYFQRLHKITRGFNGDFGGGDLNHEDIVDSHEDEMVYAAMAAAEEKEESDVSD